MHYKETDYRSMPLRVLCTSTENAIRELVSFTKEPTFLDGITAIEYGEYLYGAVFVACQAYAIGVVSDINDIMGLGATDKLSKLNLYKQGSASINGTTQIEFINALANYFKHNEEWSSWPENETTKALKNFGLTEHTEFPLKSGAEILTGNDSELRLVCEILENWRFWLVEKSYQNA
ncbi:MAG: hypothetical protein DRR42_23880 [Gammaproteobacteria bacterium]|nr:MAG: hypothetical protein DRR42_23880 [Gammaproteobacteria bacterium]